MMSNLCFANEAAHSIQLPHQIHHSYLRSSCKCYQKKLLSLPPPYWTNSATNNYMHRHSQLDLHIDILPAGSTLRPFPLRCLRRSKTRMLQSSQKGIGDPEKSRGFGGNCNRTVSNLQYPGRVRG